MSSEIEISVSTKEGSVPVTVIHIRGQIDASNVATFDDRAMAAVADGARDVLVDMADIGFMSSAGFRIIHKIYQATHQEGEGGRHLKLLNPSDEIRRLIKTLGFEKFVDVIEGDVSAAVDSF